MQRYNILNSILYFFPFCTYLIILISFDVSAAKTGDHVEIEDYDGMCDRLDAVKKLMPQDGVQKFELSVLFAFQAIAVKHHVPQG